MFGTVVNCIDGRIQIPVQEYLGRNFDPEYFDSCNETGPLKILSERKERCRVLSLKKQLAISLDVHGSRILAVVGHHDCAGNPVSREVQEKQMSEVLVYLQKTYGQDILYLGLYVDEHRVVHEIMRLE